MTTPSFFDPRGAYVSEQDPAGKLNYKFFDHYATESLMGVRDRLLAVLDDRTRQGTLFEEPPVIEIVAAVAPTVSSPAGPEFDNDIASCLSPSQVNCFVHDCEMKWYYRSVLKLPEKRDANRALGSAVHAAIAENFRQKIETKEDLAVEGVIAVFRDRWQQEIADAELAEGDNADDIKACGELLVRTYMNQAAPSVEPAAVELHVSGEIGGVAVQGYIDVLDVHGDVVDVKTASKKPLGVRADYRVQVATYAMLAPGASGRTRLQTLTKTKTVQLHTQTIDVTDADRTHATKLYQIAQEGMRSWLYVPNRSSFLCSRKYCSFWGRCVAEYGGEVE